MTFSEGREWVRGTACFPLAFWSLHQPFLKPVSVLLIHFHNNLHFPSTMTTAQPENILLCSTQAAVEHLHVALAPSSHVFHISPKIFLTIVVVHHCQHFLPYFNPDSSLNATIKHTCPRNIFSNQTNLWVSLSFTSLGFFFFSQLNKNCFK